MNRDKAKLLKPLAVLLFTAVLVFCAIGAQAENIDPDATGCKYAWAENAGWINFKPAQGSGVTVAATAVTGMAWGENIGWINLSPANGGVVNDGTGKLSGYAWAENAGWINFGPANGGVSIGSDGKFTGYAWGENIGWINFNSANACVKTAWVASAPTVSYILAEKNGTSGVYIITTSQPPTFIEYRDPEVPVGTDVTIRVLDGGQFDLRIYGKDGPGSDTGFFIVEGTYSFRALAEGKVIMDHGRTGEYFRTELVATSVPAINYTITATADVNGSISPAGVTTVNRGGSQTYTITPAPGYTVHRVVVDGAYAGAVASYSFSNLISNHTIDVYFRQVTYLITASAGAGGSITPGSSTFLPGASQTFTITPSAGYHIADVLVDGTSVGAVTSYPFTTITTNHTISAAFAANPSYTIMATAGANGSISPSGNVSVPDGANQRFTITPAPGYRIASVLVDGGSVGVPSAYTFVGVQSAHTISAVFVPDTFTITATADVNGSISPPGVTTVNRGGSQTYTITPDPGYAVHRVVVDGAYAGAVTSYSFSNLISNHTIDVYFMAIP